MIRVTVEMRYSTNRQREAVAWFVTGETPGEWLAELTRWNVPLASLRLWVVPHGAANRTPCGVLVTDTRPSPEARISRRALAPVRAIQTGAGALRLICRTEPSDSLGAAVPYACVAGKLFVPVEATFLPQLEDADWRELLPSDGEQREKTICVWHPTAGFVVFEPSQCLRVADLLQPPARGAADWNHARPGVVFNSKLTAVVPVAVPTVESLLEEGRGDIGSRGADWSKLPQREGEPSSNPLAKLGNRAVLGAAAVGQAVASAIGAAATALGKGLQALIGGAASAARGSAGRREARPARAAWSVAIEQTVQRMLERMRQSLEPARQQALRRLMKLLEKNPDEGLKFALPFGGDQYRGAAAPVDQLPERPVNFDLNRLGGSGPADRWDLPAEMSLQLMARYRELANRELHLGRYRRAAYIFAHLLNDLPAAANALVAGKHWREAAVLYRDKLGRPLEAVRCLEQGGLLVEAIELYEELRLFEKAGDLHAKLEQHEQARAAWRRAAGEHLRANDYLAAAKLIETKLADPDGALEQLDTGWSRAIQTEACLSESFRLLARLGRHSTSSERIRHWRDADARVTAAVSPAMLVQQLANLTTTYPDAGVRHLASDSARVLTSRHWATRNPAERERLLKSIAALAPEDRLLARDTRRFASLARPPAPKSLPLPKPTPNSKQLLWQVKQWKLPDDVVWQAATSSQQNWFVVGTRGMSQIVLRGDWSQTLPPTEIELPNSGASPGDPAVISAAGQDDGPLVVLNSRGNPKAIHDWRTQARRLTRDQLPAWLREDEDTVALCRQPGIVWVLREQPAHYVIEGYGEQSGMLVHTQQMNCRWVGIEFRRWPTSFFVSSLGGKYVVEDDSVLMPHYDGGWTSAGGQIQSLTGMTFEKVTRLVLTSKSGGEVLWDKGHEIRSARLSDDYVQPVAAFTRRGHLVVADRSTCDVFNADGHELRFRARGPEPTSRPLAILPAPHLDQFALITADGRVRLFEVPRP